MPIAFRLFLLLVAVLAIEPAYGDEPSTAKGRTHETAESREVKASIRRGANWLRRQQGADGGWHSETYGAMKSGVGNTGLVLAALAELPDDFREEFRSSIDGGIAFLSGNLDDRGLVRAPDGSADFPLYATAHLLSALQRHRPTSQDATRRAVREGLIRAQRMEANGWKPADPDYGGWGNAALRRAADRSDPSTVSLTAHVLEALQGDSPLPAEVQTAAARFLARCQAPDSLGDLGGGFSFTPYADDPLNKAGSAPDRLGVEIPRPYLSATCDGYRALAACRFPDESRLRTSALSFVARSRFSGLERATGAPGPEERLERGLFFYRAAAWSRVWTATRDPRLAATRLELIREVLQQQRTDGAWKNDSVSMREDDPLIATSFVVLTLARLLPE